MVDETKPLGGSSYHLFYIKNTHINKGLESIFSKEGYSAMEEKRRKVNENTLFVIEELNKKYNLDIVGVEGLFDKEIRSKEKSKYPSEIPKKELEGILKKSNYCLPIVIEKIFTNKVFTISISDTALDKEDIRTYKKIEEKIYELNRLGIMIHDKDKGHLVRNRSININSLDNYQRSILAGYLKLYEKVNKLNYKESEVAVVMILEEMNKRRGNAAVIVMGGAHTEEIKKFSRKKGISCYVLEPKGYRDKNQNQ